MARREGVKKKGRKEGRKSTANNVDEETEHLLWKIVRYITGNRDTEREGQLVGVGFEHGLQGKSDTERLRRGL